MQPSIISSRVTGGFAALLVILVIAFVASVHGASRLAELDAAVTHARAVLEEVAVARGILHEVESARRGYLIAHDNEFLELYLVATKAVVAHLERLRELTADDPAQRRRVDAIRPLAARQLTIVTESIASPTAPARDGGAARAPDDGTIITEQIRGLVAELTETERERLAERENEADVRTVKVIRSFGLVALVALLLLGAAYYVLDRDAAVHAAVLAELRSYARPPDPTPAPERDISAHGAPAPEHGMR